MNHIMPYDDTKTFSLFPSLSFEEGLGAALLTLGAYILIKKIFSFDHPTQWKKIGESILMKTASMIPKATNAIQNEVKKVVVSLEKDVFKHRQYKGAYESLPIKGLRNGRILTRIRNHMGTSPYNWENGHVSGTVYHGGKELTKLNAEVIQEYMWANPLHSDVFPVVNQMEAELIKMTANLFNGDHKVCGVMTSGGTESIFTACLAYREWGKKQKGITNPNMIIPLTAHVAFLKACQILGITPIVVNVNPKTFQADVQSMAKKITNNTIMLVGSCPSYPHGMLDPIEELSILSEQRNIPLHVDACLGGFLVPFMKKAGFHIPSFDFSLNGVTSVSADTHKYGYGPKGNSVLLWRNKNWRQYQYFIHTNWPGGIYFTPTLAGSRSGALIAATYATMLSFGEDGYVEQTKKIVTAQRELRTRLREISEIQVIGADNLSVCIIAIQSDHIDIYRLGDMMAEKGWNLNFLQKPASIHLCITDKSASREIVDQFVTDIKSCINTIKEQPGEKLHGQAAVYAKAKTVPEAIVDQIAIEYLDCVYQVCPKNGEV